MPEAKIAVPVAGACYLKYTQVWYGDFTTVDCAGAGHQAETAFVGTFTGDDSTRSTPPRQDSPALPGLYDQCQQGATGYLGGDWHTASVWLGLVLPSDGAWKGGARWFRCDLLRYADIFQTTVVDHGVLRGDLSGARSTAYGCQNTTSDKDRHLLTAQPAACDQPHTSEFAGTFTAPNVPWPADQAGREKMLDNGCQPVVATFLGYASVGQWRNQSVGWWSHDWDEDQWKLGDRTTQCFAYAYTRSGMFVGSVKGIRDQTPKG
jgi:hypothetical protein